MFEGESCRRHNGCCKLVKIAIRVEFLIKIPELAL